MSSIKDWLHVSAKILEHARIKPARLDCMVLLESELNKSREWLFAHDDEQLDDSQLNSLNTKCTLRAQRVPLAYIVGSKEFYGRPFKVTPDVLIPRPESEAMIELLKDFLKQAQNDITVLDVGTGSGCLAITTKLEWPNVEVIASDISGSALEVAKHNARTLDADIQFSKSDLIPNTDYQLPTTILANLPYVPDGLITSEEITKEPAISLFSGKDGLDHYKKLWEQIHKLRNKPFCVITESLESQHDQMKEFAKATGYKQVQSKDLAQQFILV